MGAAAQSRSAAAATRPSVGPGSGRPAKEVSSLPLSAQQDTIKISQKNIIAGGIGNLRSWPTASIYFLRHAARHLMMPPSSQATQFLVESLSELF